MRKDNAILFLVVFFIIIFIVSCTNKINSKTDEVIDYKENDKFEYSLNKDVGEEFTSYCKLFNDKEPTRTLYYETVITLEYNKHPHYRKWKLENGLKFNSYDELNKCFYDEIKENVTGQFISNGKKQLTIQYTNLNDYFKDYGFYRYLSNKDYIYNIEMKSYVVLIYE